MQDDLLENALTIVWHVTTPPVVGERAHFGIGKHRQTGTIVALLGEMLDAQHCPPAHIVRIQSADLSITIDCRFSESRRWTNTDPRVAEYETLFAACQDELLRRDPRRPPWREGAN